ncbi:MAG TPA: transglycosylase SLT domain-containing protein [Spirochaetota bacterium]|nr:transglycosylase SLT domain-containing protein [Spirochaetota bacterium]
MTKKTIVNALAALIVAAASCSGKQTDYKINFNPFFTGPDEIISGIEKQSNNYYNNYILARAYAGKKELKSAMLYYANSCFTSKYNFSLRLFPHPVYAFLDSYSSKSPYYDDAVYEIASIFYQYNEHEYVIKFTGLIKDDSSALYRNSMTLKARSLQKLNRFQEAEKLLISLAEKYPDSNSAADIYMKLASVYESSGRFTNAVSSYLKIIRLTKNVWHDDIAVKRILYLITTKNVKVNGDEDRIAIAESLFESKDYAGAEKYLNGILQKGENPDASLLYLKILSRKKQSEAAKFLKLLENKPEYAKFALANANELWDNGNKYAAVQVYSKIADSSDKDIAERVLTRLSFYYEERNNPLLIKYMEIYRKLFPDNSLSGRFTWLMGRYRLKTGNYSAASTYFNQCIKKYPTNQYTANCRYWLFKITNMKKDPSENDRLKLLQDLALYNPESVHTLSLISEVAEKTDTAVLTRLYKKAYKDDNTGLMHLYHTMLFMKEGYTESWIKRFSDLDSDITSRYKSFNRLFTEGSLKSDYRKILTNLDRYFAAGDIESINRELKLIPENEPEVMLDTALALSRLSLKYGHYNYSTYYAFKLLDLMDIPENLALLSPEFAKSLYPYAFRKCVNDESRRTGVKPEVVLAMMKAESNFNVTAVSPAGATGLMQLMPLTARGIGKEIGVTDFNLKDPCTSIKFGTHYIAWLHRYYKGKIELMVAGYNAGAGNVDTWLKRFKDKDLDYISEFTPFQETRDYIFRTKKFMSQYRSVYKSE